MPSRANCPCGRPTPYAACCQPLHDGQTTAATAEQLMRSRYTAFVVHNAPYLLTTWSAKTRPSTIDFDPSLEWTGLEILSTTAGTAFHTEGTVEFHAHHTTNGVPGTHQETSTFTREDGNWVYVTGH
jgi:SEC-C motif-containing protein